MLFRSADRASKRWVAGKPLSLIDGMPIGVKDIMETADMPTQQAWNNYLKLYLDEQQHPLKIRWSH